VSAPPAVTMGWNAYINFNKQQTKLFQAYQEAGYFGSGMIGVACTKIPNWAAQAACAVVALAKGTQLASAVRHAAETDTCLQIAVPYPALSTPSLAAATAWFGWYKGGFCK
jgi:hypothetical protein